MQCDGESDFCLASFKSVNDVCHRSRMEFMCFCRCLKLSTLFYFLVLFTMLSLAKYAKCFRIATSIVCDCRIVGRLGGLMTNCFQLTDLSLWPLIFFATLRNHQWAVAVKPMRKTRMRLHSAFRISHLRYIQGHWKKMRSRIWNAFLILS